MIPKQHFRSELTFTSAVEQPMRENGKEDLERELGK